MQVSRVGVIGCGYWGSKHLRVLSGLPEVERVVAIDLDEGRLERAKAAHPMVEVSNDLDAAVRDLDALVIATPAHTHADLGVLAMQAGTSVLIEKPLATDVADGMRLIDEADRTGQVLMAGHTFEYNAAVVTLKELIDAGELGEVLYIDAARLNLGLFQPDVNVIWDLAPHDVSVINYLLGVKPSTVRAWGSRHVYPDCEDVAYIRIDYADRGVSAQVHVSWLDPCKVRRITVVGSKKMAVYNELNADERIRVYDKGLTLHSSDGDPHYPVSYRYGSIMSPYIEFEEPLLVEDEHFLDCVANRTTPRTDGYNGLAVVAALQAANGSLTSGHTIDVETPTNLVRA